MSSPYLSHTAAAYREAADALDAERVARWARIKTKLDSTITDRRAWDTFLATFGYELDAINDLEREARALRREAAEIESDVRQIEAEERRQMGRAA